MSFFLVLSWNILSLCSSFSTTSLGATWASCLYSKTRFFLSAFGEHSELQLSALNVLPCCSPAGLCAPFTRCVAVALARARGFWTCTRVRPPPPRKVKHLLSRATREAHLLSSALFSDPLLLHTSPLRRCLWGSSCKNVQDARITWEFHGVSHRRP